MRLLAIDVFLDRINAWKAVRLKIHILCSVPPPPENNAVYERMQKNLVESADVIQCMRVAC